nr:hypothetical protein [Tanacetum cinerariifolium]
MDLFNLISTPNPTKVKIGLCPCTAHEVPLLTATVSRMIDMEDPDASIESSRTLSTIEKSSLDFDNENPSQQITEEVGVEEEIAAMGPLLSKKRRKRGDPDSKKSSSFTSLVGSLGNIYKPGWGVTNDCRLDTSTPCQDMVDHIVPPGNFLKLRHLPNDDFLGQYNMNLARQVPIGSQLRLRFEQEVRQQKRATKRIAKLEQRIQVREEEIKKLDQEVQGLQNLTSNLKTLLEAEADMKKAAEVSDLQAQVTGEERIKAAFEEFKKCEDERVNSRDRGSPVGYRAWPAPGRNEMWRVSRAKEGIYECPPRAERSEVPNSGSAGELKGCPNGEEEVPVVCRTHGVGSAYHARSDGVPVSLPNFAPQGLAILLADAATQIETSEDDAWSLLKTKDWSLLKTNVRRWISISSNCSRIVED